MPSPPPNRPAVQHASVLAGLILGALALYLVPLRAAAFYFDDRSAILNNEVIRTLDIPVLFRAFNTRFLAGLSFAVNYQWCGLHPFGWHLVNTLIHGLNAFLVYLLALAVLTLPVRRWPAILASVIFLCHPIQTEAVNSITQRFVLLGGMFYLLAVNLYIRWRLKPRAAYLALALISAVAAFLCKEFTVTLPLMLVLYELCLGPDGKKPWKALLPFFITALIVPFLLSQTPPQAVKAARIAQRDVHHIDITRANGAVSRHEYFLTELNVMRTYVRLLFVPVHQNFDYDYPITSSIDARTMFSLLFLLCLLAIAWAARRRQRMVSFAILWFFIALSVESSLIPIGHVIAEYRLYLACAGFALLAAFLIYSRPVVLPKLNILATAVVLVLCVMTLHRNTVWKDEFSLWNDVVSKSPNKSRGYNNRGLEYYGQGKFIQAEADFDKAIDLKPDFAEAYNNRGVLYGQQGLWIQAIADFSKAVELKPDYESAYHNRAYTYFLLKDYHNAQTNAAKAKKLGDPVRFRQTQTPGLAAQN